MWDSQTPGLCQVRELCLEDHPQQRPPETRKEPASTDLPLLRPPGAQGEGGGVLQELQFPHAGHLTTSPLRLPFKCVQGYL